MFSLTEIADCVRDLLPKSVVYEVPSLDCLNVELPTFTLYNQGHSITTYHGQLLGTNIPLRFESLFDLQDWIVTTFC
ncbi:hypothetical protein RsoM2USA_289 [Ralstonia phage RsoM2USA]|nr:hypothetical protein RsoM2USA_289 [Ralstonia phage RsoM2USA]